MEAIRRAAFDTFATVRNHLRADLFIAGLAIVVSVGFRLVRGESLGGPFESGTAAICTLLVAGLMVFAWHLWKAPGRMRVARIEASANARGNEDAREWMLNCIAEDLARYSDVEKVAVFGSSSWLYPPQHDVDVAVLLRKPKHTRKTLAALERNAQKNFKRKFHFGDDVHLSLHPYYTLELHRWDKLLSEASNVRMMRDRE